MRERAILLGGTLSANGKDGVFRIHATIPSVTRRVIERMARQPTPELGDDAKLRDLTPRERDVLALIAVGSSNREIATALGLEESTARMHVKHILLKLDLRDRVQVVIFAYESAFTRPGGKPAHLRNQATRMVPPAGAELRVKC